MVFPGGTLSQPVDMAAAANWPHSSAGHASSLKSKPTVAGSSPSLNVESDGKANGNATCNRFFGGYQLPGEGLTVGSVGASMMMCDDALMDQEGQIFKVLKELAGFGISGDGKLILRTSDGRTMAAKPDA